MPQQHFTSVVALTKPLAITPRECRGCVSTPFACMMCAKPSTKTRWTELITAPDVTSTLPHCETINVEWERRFCSVFMVRNLYDSTSTHADCLALYLSTWLHGKPHCLCFHIYPSACSIVPSPFTSFQIRNTWGATLCKWICKPLMCHTRIFYKKRKR